MSKPYAQSSPFCSLVPFRVEGEEPPLFFLHGVTGTTEFAPLYPYLPQRYPLYGVQAQALDPGGRILTSLEDLAAYYLAEIRAVQPHGPYFFIGFSFGGMLAFEMAQQLVAQGEGLPFLGMIDSTEMTYLRRTSNASSPDKRASDFYQRVRRRLTEAIERADTIAYLQEKIYSRSLRFLYRVASKLRVPLPSSLHKPFHVNWFAAVNYHPRPYPGKVILFKATEHFWEPGMPGDLGWGPLAGLGVEIHSIAGSHTNIFTEPSVCNLASNMTNALREYVETQR